MKNGTTHIAATSLLSLSSCFHLVELRSQVSYSLRLFKTQSSEDNVMTYLNYSNSLDMKYDKEAVINAFRSAILGRFDQSFEKVKGSGNQKNLKYAIFEFFKSKLAYL